MLTLAPFDCHRILTGERRAVDRRALALVQAAVGRSRRVVVIDASGRWAWLEPAAKHVEHEHEPRRNQLSWPKDLTIHDISQLAYSERCRALRLLARGAPQGTQLVFTGCGSLLGDWGVVSDLGDLFAEERKSGITATLCLDSLAPLADPPSGRYGSRIEHNAYHEQGARFQLALRLG